MQDKGELETEGLNTKQTWAETNEAHQNRKFEWISNQRNKYAGNEGELN